MKILNGRELVGYIQERQAKTARSLRQSQGIQPRLAIIRTNPHPVVDGYMKLKQAYGEAIGVAVDVHTIKQIEAAKVIQKLNGDISVHGIIIQLPLPDISQTDEILQLVTREKDVDGLAPNSSFDPATPMAINWLLAGYNVDIANKHMVIVGQGRLVGAPLARIWKASGLDVEVADKHTIDLAAVTRAADVLVTATGKPNLIKASMVKNNAVIIDAGVAMDKNDVTGDVAAEVRELPDITITAEKGGVGPLTVCALFENVLLAARQLNL